MASPPKDYYTILGVSESASAEQIRAAYLERSRVLHPDRFDPKSQGTEWRQANRMFAELNEAYAALRDPKSRARYDSERRKEASDPQPKSEDDSDEHTFERGESAFQDLVGRRRGCRCREGGWGGRGGGIGQGTGVSRRGGKALADASGYKRGAFIDMAPRKYSGRKVGEFINRRS